jgi:predicted  nucleic acid-binding Zn ribbon protein
LKTQEDLQKQLSEKISKQEEFQTGVLNRLDQQEALTEKIFRQLNHIRSILFERTNYLAEKIDEGYKITSSYVYKLMTGSDQPITFYLMNNKKEEKQR